MAPAVLARMLDQSRSGFRARHNCPSLVSGQIVRFTRGNACGRARVVWTRIFGDCVESGFHILPSEPG
jgi:hypothetical protein